MNDSRLIFIVYHNRMFRFQNRLQSSVSSSSELASTVLEHFSNKKEMVPPGTSRTDRCLSLARMASMSIAERIDSNCVLPALGLIPSIDCETIFRRMSSWMWLPLEGVRQLIWVHSPKAARPAFFFCKYWKIYIEQNFAWTIQTRSYRFVYGIQLFLSQFGCGNKSLFNSRIFPGFHCEVIWNLTVGTVTITF